MDPAVKPREKKIHIASSIGGGTLPAYPRIDVGKCLGCGLCVGVCPKEILAVVDGHAVLQGGESMACDHCGAACPADAIEVPAVTADLFAFKTFRADSRWLPHGRFDLPALVNLMGSRRSCRNFLSRPVERALLMDLVKAGVTAPSGTNCQPWTFTLLPNRDALDRLGQCVGDFFSKVNRMAERAWLRRGLRLLGRPELDTYYREHLATVKRGLEAYATHGRDLLFHGATAGIVVAADNDASCPAEDALLATGNILLAAHAMGLGSCLIGYAIEAMRRDRRIVRGLGIPDNETPYAVIALGWPDEAYQRVAWRKPVTIRDANR